jgi:hypothetical protein
MDGSAFRHVSLVWLFTWPILILIVAGLLSLLGGFGVLVWWIVSHLAWV